MDMLMTRKPAAGKVRTKIYNLAS